MHLDSAALHLGRGHTPYKKGGKLPYLYASITPASQNIAVHLDSAALHLGRGHAPYKIIFIKNGLYASITPIFYKDDFALLIAIAKSISL